jgi:Uma2 family endonuclease
MKTIMKLTYDDYAAMPEDGRRYQLVEGELFVSPSPSSRHQRILMVLVNALYDFVKARKLGEVFAAPLDVILSEEDTYQPDIVYVSKARKRLVVPEGIRGTPDLCVEILSPSNRKLDVKVKRARYAKFGLPELWIVDPDEDTVRIYRPAEDANAPVRTLSENDTLTTDLLPGFALKLAAVFEPLTND